MKNFLRPTPMKILIASILFIFFVPIIEYANNVRCIIPPCPQTGLIPLGIWLFCSANHNFAGFNYLIMATGLVLVSLIACSLCKFMTCGEKSKPLSEHHKK